MQDQLKFGDGIAVQLGVVCQHKGLPQVPEGQKPVLQLLCPECNQWVNVAKIKRIGNMLTNEMDRPVEVKPGDQLRVLMEDDS